MNKIDRKHIVLQVKTKNVIRFPPLEKLLSLKVMKPSKTAVKTADRSDHFKRHCKCHIDVSTDISWLNSNITPWFETMKNDYDQFFQAVLDEEAEVCEELIGKGLDINAKHFWDGQRPSALQLAMPNSKIFDFLLDLGAAQD